VLTQIAIADQIKGMINIVCWLLGDGERTKPSSKWTIGAIAEYPLAHISEV
jgi:hypothetical protein